MKKNRMVTIVITSIMFCNYAISMDSNAPQVSVEQNHRKVTMQQNLFNPRANAYAVTTPQPVEKKVLVNNEGRLAQKFYQEFNQALASTQANASTIKHLWDIHQEILKQIQDTKTSRPHIKFTQEFERKLETIQRQREVAEAMALKKESSKDNPHHHNDSKNDIMIITQSTHDIQKRAMASLIVGELHLNTIKQAILTNTDIWGKVDLMVYLIGKLDDYSAQLRHFASLPQNSQEKFPDHQAIIQETSAWICEHSHQILGLALKSIIDQLNKNSFLRDARSWDLFAHSIRETRILIASCPPINSKRPTKQEKAIINYSLKLRGEMAQKIYLMEQDIRTNHAQPNPNIPLIKSQANVYARFSALYENIRHSMEKAGYPGYKKASHEKKHKEMYEIAHSYEKHELETQRTERSWTTQTPSPISNTPPSE